MALLLGVVVGLILGVLTLEDGQPLALIVTTWTPWTVLGSLLCLRCIGRHARHDQEGSTEVSIE